MSCDLTMMLLLLVTKVLTEPTKLSDKNIFGMKRKPRIFNFKWNFGLILGQHNILVLGNIPPSPPNQKKKILSKVRFELANVTPPP